MQNWFGGGGDGTTCIYMYKQHSIVITGNFNADFKLLTHNRYSVLNGHFVRQIHPSSFMVEHLTVVSDYLKSNNINVDGSFGLCLHSFAVTLSIPICGVLFLNLKF